MIREGRLDGRAGHDSGNGSNGDRAGVSVRMGDRAVELLLLGAVAMRNPQRFAAQITIGSMSR
jgi:hypothetical protein